MIKPNKKFFNYSLPVFLLAVFLTGTSCVSFKTHSLVADTSLILPYTFELEDKKHLTAPYVAKYQRDGKLLLYVASDHISIKKSPNLLEHPTLKTIERLFLDYSPEVVVVEGIDTGDEISPKSILKKAEQCEASHYKSCGESLFSINMARKTGAAYITGEPRDRQIKEEIQKEGYNAEDLLGFYLVRQIPQLTRHGEFNRKTFAEKAEVLLRGFQEQLETNVKFGFGEFDLWYKSHMKNPKSYLDITTNDPAPDGGPEATYIQKIS